MIIILEHDLQNQIRLAISENKLGVSFRCNVGQAWTGNDVRKNPDRSITIYNPRPFQSGLPAGFSDLLIIQPVIVTPAMVGQQIAAACFLEVKTKKRKPTQEQLNFLEQMNRLGGKGGVVRSVEEAIQILQR